MCLEEEGGHLLNQSTSKCRLSGAILCVEGIHRLGPIDFYPLRDEGASITRMKDIFFWEGRRYQRIRVCGGHVERR